MTGSIFTQISETKTKQILKKNAIYVVRSHRWSFGKFIHTHQEQIIH